MKPSRPYHAFTADHREPGGLRRLDFFIKRLAAWRGEKLPELVRILVVQCGRGHVALPLASLGYNVTVTESDSSLLALTQESAKDVGLPIRSAQFGHHAFDRETFDVIIALHIFDEPGDIPERLATLAAMLSRTGIAFLEVPHATRWSRTVPMLRPAGLRLRRYLIRSLFLRRLSGFLFTFGLRRGSELYHVLDALDGVLASRMPRAFGDGFVFELTPCDPAKPYVVHLIPTFAAGGAERLVFDVTSRLPDHGFETGAIALMGSGPVERAFQEAGVPHTVYERSGPFGSFVFFRLLRDFALERPDIVHTHLFGADLWGRLAAFLARAPVVVMTEHNVHPQRSGLKWIVNALLTRWTDIVIAVSQAVKRDLSEQRAVPARKIRVIRNGIDLRRVQHRTPRAFADIPRLITVGRLATQKGHATLLKALGLVKRPWTLDVVGVGPLEKDLRALAERLRIAPRIRWLGNRDDVPSLLAASDLFCFPSHWEGLGLALLEAAAAGVPILASDLPVFHEILPDGAMTHASVGDVPEWARAIDQLLQDPFSAIQLAHAGIDSVSTSFGIERMVKGYAGLYNELLKAHKP